MFTILITARITMNDKISGFKYNRNRILVSLTISPYKTLLTYKWKFSDYTGATWHTPP